MRRELPRRPPPPASKAAGDMLVEAKDVVVRLGGYEILRGVSMSVRAGQMVALVGPNGAGKSTLLSVLAGDMIPWSGSVIVHGEPLGSLSLAELALLRTLLPQHPTVSFGFSVQAVVEMARSPWARTKEAARDKEIVAAAMQDTDVVRLAGRRYISLSGGEKARASLARVLAQKTQVLLLDEPTAALDVHHTEVVFGALHRRISQGAACVVVVHDLQLAAAHADTVVLLQEGKIAAMGEAHQVLNSSVLSSVYDHEIDVMTHPASGIPLVLPMRHRSRGRQVS